MLGLVSTSNVSADVDTDIEEIYIGLLGRAADNPGLQYWRDEINRGILTIEQLRANIVNEQPEYVNGIGSYNREDTATALYQNLFHRDPGADGREYWVNGGGSGVNTDQLVLALSDGASTNDRLILDNTVSGALYYTSRKGTDALYDQGLARAVIVDIDSTTESVDASRAITDAIPNDPSTAKVYVANFGNGLGDCGQPHVGFTTDLNIDDEKIATIRPGEKVPMVLTQGDHSVEFVQQDGYSEGATDIAMDDHGLFLVWSCDGVEASNDSGYQYAAREDYTDTDGDSCFDGYDEFPGNRDCWKTDSPATAACDLVFDPTTSNDGVCGSRALQFDFTDFTEISVPTVFNVTVVQGQEFMVQVTVDEDVADRIDVTQTGSVLSIALAFGDSNIQTLEAFVTMPVLNRIELTGVVTASISNFNQASMTVDVGNVSQLRGDGLTIGDLTATISGVSQLDFGDSHPVDIADVTVSGVSKATLNMAIGSTLTASVSSQSNLFYYGTDVTLDIPSDSSSSVERLGDTRP